MKSIKRMTIEFMTLDDGYATTQGTAYIDGGYFVTKQGRGEFDVLNKISKFFTDYTIESILGDTSKGYDEKALEDHITRLLAEQGASE